MRRRLLILAIGIFLLLGITWLVSNLADYIPHKPTPQAQTVLVGPYDVTLRVDPNPPTLDQPATLSIQIVQHTSRQPVSGVRVVVDGAMESMDMGTTEVVAHEQSSGTYTARMPFSMSGPWQVQVLISTSSHSPLNAVFTVTTQ